MRILNQRGDNRVSGITWAQDLGEPGCPYARRWVLNLGGWSLRIHHWFSGDDPRYLHEHPWWFLTFVIRGGYTDIGRDGTDELRAPAIRYRPALHAHTVSAVRRHTWTLLITGRPLRDWGFYTDQGWMRMRRFFRTYGHHQCE
jgi:hypothetical protein